MKKLIPFAAFLLLPVFALAQTTPEQSTPDTVTPNEILATQAAIRKQGPRVPHNIYKKIVPTYVDKGGELTEQGEAVLGDGTFEIAVAGSTVKVTRIGNGPVGVIFFPHTGAKKMNQRILENQSWLKDISPEKCSLFLWEYPTSSPFDQVQSTIQSYREDKTAKLLLTGIASSVISQIRQKSGLKEILVVGNSLGAGIVLQDYASLVGDQTISYLLVSPTEAFMPSPEKIPPLERTVLIGSKGSETGSDDHRFSTDPFLRGMDEKPGDTAWHWFRKNQNIEWGDLITESTAAVPERVVGNTHYTKPTDFTSGHKTIGFEITNELLAKLIRVKMEWADKAILAEPPKQPNPAYPYYPVSQ